MSKTNTSTFGIESWNETECPDWDGGKLTRTIATKKIEGEIQGTAYLEAVMLRLDGEQEGIMAYVGVERVSCTLDGKTGSFVLIHNAEAVRQDQKATWKIMTGSGTGELAGIKGHGDITPDHKFTLHYELGPS